MKKFLLALAVAAMVTFSVRADEGMWLLPYLQKVNYAEMKAKGLKLNPEDIYSAQHSSLKDAIVIFGRGCTGEIVSPDGLIFTNHHCGYGNIQSLSSVDHDYLANGFWAMNRAEEIPVPDLSVQFIRSIHEVTVEMLEGINIETAQADRDRILGENRNVIVNRMQAENPGKKIELKSFFGGNDYFAFVIEEYTDIRFVGAPPTSIGKFGGDTDNWMWPRHTGDFSIFRVYSAPDGSPAAYSENNVPYKAPVHLKISAKGYKEGDFAMVMGFPGTTTRYMTTYEIDEMLDVSNPIRIYVRGEKQDIIKKDMVASDKVRIQYAAKYAQSSNYWKNSIGKSKAVKQLKVRDRTEELESRFQIWAEASPERAPYANALPLIRDSKAETVAIEAEMQYLLETILSPIEIATLGYSAFVLGGRGMNLADLKEPFYKDYNEATDKKVAKRMIEILIDRLPAESLPGFVQTDVMERFNGDVGAYIDWLYETSVFANAEKYMESAVGADSEVLANDPAVRMAQTTRERYFALANGLAGAKARYTEGHRLYIDGLRRMNPDTNYYPDANFSIRLTYGTVLPYSPADAVEYDYYTTLKGVMQKEDPENPVEFTVPAKLKELYEAQDYGRYADFTGVSKKDRKKGNKGHLNTCFLSTNDITGGNSGSPVLNGNGELIGLAFDGNWEAMSGDVVFEPQLQRCINVDVRYVLFVIDRFAGAGHLLDEMTIVW